MLIRCTIWMATLFICVISRPGRHGSVFDMQEKMGTSRKVRHLKMNLEDGKDPEDKYTLTRQKRSYELHDWLSHEQKQEVQKMENDKMSKQEIVNRMLEFFSKLSDEEKKKWGEKYKKLCIKWLHKVATENEIAELETLRMEQNIEEYSAKLNEYKSRLPEEEQEQIDLWKDGCNKLYSMDAQQSLVRSFRHSLSRRSGYDQILTSEQIALVEDMKAGGAIEKNIERKVSAQVEQYYSVLPQHKKKELDSQYKAKCIQWIQEVTNFNEIQLLLYSFKRGNRLVFNTLLEEYFERLPKEEQEKLHYIKDICREMWREVMNSSRQKRYVDEEYNEWIIWMTDEQKHELQEMRNNGSSFDDIHRKVNGHFLKLPEALQKQFISDYKEKCKKYFLALAREDEIKKLEADHDHTNHDEHKKLIDEILNRQSQDIRDKAYKFYQICDDVYHKQIGRSKRDVDALMEKHLSWLTSEQKAEIKMMKESGEPLSTIRQKLLSHIKNMGTEKQRHVIEKTKESCYEWLNEVTSAEERAELEKLHHTDHSACKRKVPQNPMMQIL
uniref:Polyprotein allergen nematode domain-containing protein n=1 Tax=Setaria digitata TaxID=48799 RepID=A0A915PXG5_9BILA